MPRGCVAGSALPYLPVPNAAALQQHELLSQPVKDVCQGQEAEVGIIFTQGLIEALKVLIAARNR